MIIRNDSISEASFASWQPSSISNLSDWWVASSGLTLDGSSVNAWSGLSSTSFVPAASKAAYISSDPYLNDHPSIQINPSSAGGDNGYWVKSTYSPLGKTMIVIGYMIDPISENCVMSVDTVSGDPYLSAGSAKHSSLFSHPSGNYAAFYAGDGGSGAVLVDMSYPSANNTFMYAMVEVDTIFSQAKYYSSISPSLGDSLYTKTSIQTGIDSYETLILGGYNNAYGSSPKMNISEIISLNGILKDIDKINLDNYVSNKYFNL